MSLDTGGFIKKLFQRAVQGDPLGIIEDLRQSAEDEAKEKEKASGNIIDTTGEESKE